MLGFAQDCAIDNCNIGKLPKVVLVVYNRWIILLLGRNLPRKANLKSRKSNNLMKVVDKY